MKKALLLLVLLTTALAAPCGAADEAIDWDRARELFRRSQGGETLSPPDQSYLEKAKAARRQTARPRGGSQRKAPATLKPLSDMTAEDRYETEDGGLYGAGLDEPPEALQKAAEEALTHVKPLDAEGRPAPEGKVVFISISMSNATMEFSTFKRLADPDPRKSPHVTIVDCAQGGQAMAEWAPAEARPWQEALNRLKKAGVTPQQVQVAWVKLANKAPAGAMNEHLAKLEADTVAVLQNAKKQFPNLRVCYLGSRIWAGNAKGALNPEPYAYEGAFAVRHLIQRQMKAAPELAADKAPLLLWGPYLWAEGEKGRQGDDLKWKAADFSGDGVHPSEQGREKVAKLLLDFFTTNPLAKGWFARG